MRKLYFRKTSLLFIVALFAGSVFAKTNTLPGSGTEDEPYLIATYQDLKSISADLTAIYSLTADIDASLSKWDDQYVWIPLGTSVTPFTGKLYGHGHTISKLYVNAPTLTNIGLFGFTNGATIDAVGLLQAEISSAGAAGLLVGYAKSTTITDSYATGIVKAPVNVGGLVGFANASTLTNSFANAELFGATASAGGLVGSNNYASVINGSYSAGNIHFLKPGTGIGGLTGFLSGTISNSYSRTNILTDSVVPSPTMGGLVGIAFKSTITNAYSTGLLQGSFPAIGGALGLNNLSTATALYWDTQTSQQAASASGLGRTSTELKSSATYAGFDFTGTWKIGSINDGYPTLLWQTTNAPAKINNVSQSVESVRIARTSNGFEIGMYSQDLLNATVFVYSLTGKEVYRGILTSDKTSVNLPAGNYVGKITSTQNGTVRFKALVY